MPEEVPPPTFAEISAALLELVRHEAACQEIAEPFMASLPVHAPGIEHAHKMLQRRLVLMAEAQRLFALMVPKELEIRGILGLTSASRKL